MPSSPRRLRRFIPALSALALLTLLYFLCQKPSLSRAEGEDLAGRFRFSQHDLPVVDGPAHKVVRQVHPSLRHISAWLSSLGASVALGDLDGDGLPNDVCYVDPRTDQVIVGPAPGTPGRYPPFVLSPAPLPHDPASSAPTGCLIGDFNEDGLPDLLVYFWGRTPVLFLRKGGEPEAASLSASSYLPRELVSSAERWYTSAVTQADFDGDGHVDLLIANYFPDGARVLDANATGVESMHDTKAKSFTGGAKHFFLWAGASKGKEPSVQFRATDAGLSEEVNHGWTLAAGAADLDRDLLPEIYLSNDFGPDRLLHNRSTPGKLQFAVATGRRTITDPASCVLGRDSYKGMGLDFADLNGDGVPDIYVSNIATNFGLHESHFLWLSTGDPGSLLKEGIAPYRHGSEELGLARSGWGWDCRLADFDNDGVLEAVQAVGYIKGKVNRWPELQSLGAANSSILKHPGLWPRFQPGDDLSGHEVNPFFVRAKTGRYHNIGPSIGFTEPTVSRGIALADVDGDGKLDFATANQWGPSYLFRNTSPSPGAFLGLRVLMPLARTTSPQSVVHPGQPDRRWGARPAIGARVRVHTPNGVDRTAQVDGGSGHSGKRSQDLHFGLSQTGANEKVEVQIDWRDPEGTVRTDTLLLTPGWHAVLLPWPLKK